MGYYVELVNKETNVPMTTFRTIFLQTGNTYNITGSNEMSIHITSNYYPGFNMVFGSDRGLNVIHNMSAKESTEKLYQAIGKLDTDTDENYYKATQGNVREALVILLAFALLCPTGVWKVS